MQLCWETTLDPQLVKSEIHFATSKHTTVNVGHIKFYPLTIRSPFKMHPSVERDS